MFVEVTNSVSGHHRKRFGEDFERINGKKLKYNEITGKESTFLGKYIESGQKYWLYEMNDGSYIRSKIHDYWEKDVEYNVHNENFFIFKNDLENLKVTHYNNGYEITHIINVSGEFTGSSCGDCSGEWWGTYDEGQYGVYDNDPSNADIYGNLYNWAVVGDSRGVCPEDWHVPSDEEFMELEMFLGMSEEEADNTGWRGTDEGSKLAGKSDLWGNYDLENNSEFGSSGFNVLPGGMVWNSDNTNEESVYKYMLLEAYYWSSSDGSISNSDGEIVTAYLRRLNRNVSQVSRDEFFKRSGYSIRCLGD